MSIDASNSLISRISISLLRAFLQSNQNTKFVIMQKDKSQDFPPLISFFGKILDPNYIHSKRSVGQEIENSIISVLIQLMKEDQDVKAIIGK